MAESVEDAVNAVARMEVTCGPATAMASSVTAASRPTPAGTSMGLGSITTPNSALVAAQRHDRLDVAVEHRAEIRESFVELWEPLPGHHRTKLGASVIRRQI